MLHLSQTFESNQSKLQARFEQDCSNVAAHFTKAENK